MINHKYCIIFFGLNNNIFDLKMDEITNKLLISTTYLEFMRILQKHKPVFELLKYPDVMEKMEQLNNELVIEMNADVAYTKNKLAVHMAANGLTLK